MKSVRWTIAVRAHVEPDEGEALLVSDQKMLHDDEVEMVFDPDDTLSGAAVIYRTVAPMIFHINAAIQERNL